MKLKGHYLVINKTTGGRKSSSVQSAFVQNGLIQQEGFLWVR